MEVVSTPTTSSNGKTEPFLVDSYPSSPLNSKQVSEYGSEYSSPAVNSGPIDQSDHNYQSDSSTISRKDVEVQSPAYLKSEEYRLLFRLPTDEMLIQDFNCAFQESILLQGHMYLFIRHICFYSNIFGFETKKTIPFNEMTCVRKAKTAGIFPTAIEIVAGVKKYFFASFLSRDEAYRLIVDGWSQHINGSNVVIDHQDLKSEIVSEDHGGENCKGSEKQFNDLQPSDRNKDGDGDLSGASNLFVNGEDEVTVSSMPWEAHENGEEAAEPVLNSEPSSSRESLPWRVEDADAPKVPDYYTKVAESKFPVQVEELFNLFFSDKAVNFIASFRKSCGDKDFRCTPWSDDTQFGLSRQLSFQHPIKVYFGAKFGQCHEVQILRVYRNSHLVIETSQDVSDVPYADYFRVEGRWIVERDGNESSNSCNLRVYVNVAFLKKTMWKGKIEQSTMDECREAYSIWIDNAHELLKQHIEKLDRKTSAPDMNSSDAQVKGNERDESSLIHDTSNDLPIPLMASDTTHGSPPIENSLGGNLSAAASFSLTLFRESLARFSVYLKSQNHLPLVLVVASVLILLMQLSIIVLLTRAPQVHLISQVDHMNGIGSSTHVLAEAEAWLEKRIHFLKDEMHMVEARLEKMLHEHAMLKEHFKGLELLRGARQ
ncbi:Vascular associated death 1 protein [Thalictrum thalictroides]|uniref:Vascular associated death 1 protein n=1 Tax=Thalictrum thalictroides TaxID=46969 RepID=A0A7J6VVK9_THATH|nr:Vascular associated death 1 protein [Thalictrum thalictroides]